MSLALNLGLANLGGGGGGAAPSTTIYRAYNMGMNVGSSMNGGTARSMMNAANFLAPFQFRYFRVMQHLFYQNGANLTDTFIPNPINFAYAFSPVKRSIFTGIAARSIWAKWSNVTASANYLAIDNAVWDNSVMIALSDRVDLGVYTQEMDYWCAQSLPASVVSPNNNLLIAGTSVDNLIPHGIGTKSSTTLDYCTGDNFKTDTSITAAPATAGGSGNVKINPFAFLIEVPNSTECVMVIGNSHLAGFNAGQGAHLVNSVEYGGPSGDAHNDVSWLDKGIAAKNMGYFKIDKASDGDKNWLTANNWRGRKQGMIAANGTRIINEDATNTITGATSSLDTSVSASFVRGDSIRAVSAAKVFLCLTPATLPINPTEFNAAVAFGTVVASNGGTFMYMGAYSANLRNAVAGVGKQLLMSDQIRAQWPTLPFIRTGMLPQPTSTDSFVTLANQTAESNGGSGLTSKRGIYMTLMQTPEVQALHGLSYFIRPDSFVENDNVNFDGLIQYDAAVANKFMSGQHMTSYGHTQLAPAVTPASVGLIGTPQLLYNMTQTGMTKEADATSYNLGVEIQALTAGYLDVVYFYKPSGSTQTFDREAGVWKSSDKSSKGYGGLRLENEPASGWIAAPLFAPVTLAANEKVIVSITVEGGGYAAAVGGLNADVTGAPGGGFKAIATASSTLGNGNFKTGLTIGCPNTGGSGANYWVNPRFIAGTPPVFPPNGYPGGTGGPTVGPTGALTPSGSVSSSANNQIIENLDITGSVTITHTGVILRNCRIKQNNSATYNVSANGAPTISYCEIDGGANGSFTGVGLWDGGTITNCKIHGFENGLIAKSNSVVTNNYIYRMRYDNEPSPHYDCMEFNGGTNLTVSGNTFQNLQTQTSCVMLDNLEAGLSNILVTNNAMGGGGYTLYCDGHFGGGTVDNATILITNNLMYPGSVSYFAFNTSNPTRSGNVNVYSRVTF